MSCFRGQIAENKENSIGRYKIDSAHKTSNLEFITVEFTKCAGFGWVRVTFLPSGWPEALLWVSAGNSVENTGEFQLLPSSC